MEYLVFIFVWLIGLLCGIFTTLIKRSHGMLKIDKSDSEKDSYLFEIDDLDKIERVSWIRLKVVKTSKFRDR